ncbi:MAG: hypothetical protein AAFR79_11560 [Pseudomonadota bacterium]
MADEATEAKIRKIAGEAERALAKLEGEISKATKGIARADLDPSKAKAASAKVRAFMSTYTQLTKLQSSPVYAQLSPHAQALVDWMDGVMAALLGVMGALDGTKKAAGLDPKKKRPMILVETKRAMTAVRKQPQGLGTLVKQIEKGVDVGGPAGAGISVLPMVIILWYIGHVIAEWLKNRPKE